MAQTDPFAAPIPPSSSFASADSFRGRLILMKATKVERDVPSQDDPSKKSDRYTVDVTTVDGKGPVQVYSYSSPTGKMLEGPTHKGVWFSQQRLADSLEFSLKNDTGILGTLETQKPGERARKGNAWGLINPTEADKQTARDFLANRTISEAAAPVSPADSGEKNPFGN